MLVNPHPGLCRGSRGRSRSARGGAELLSGAARRARGGRGFAVSSERKAPTTGAIARAVRPRRSHVEPHRHRHSAEGHRQPRSQQPAFCPENALPCTDSWRTRRDRKV